MNVAFGSASATVVAENGQYVVSDLKSHGRPGDLLRLLREIRGLSSSGPVLLWVDHENPKFDQLCRVYSAMGAVKKGIIMQVGAN